MSEKTITVCSYCLQASCWQGIFMCDESKNAGTVEKTIKELEELGLEDKSFWDIDPNTGVSKQWII